jgi:hypothetical protein
LYQLCVFYTKSEQQFFIFATQKNGIHKEWRDPYHQQIKEFHSYSTISRAYIVTAPSAELQLFVGVVGVGYWCLSVIIQ